MIINKYYYLCNYYYCYYYYYYLSLIMSSAFEISLAQVPLWPSWIWNRKTSIFKQHNIKCDLYFAFDSLIKTIHNVELASQQGHMTGDLLGSWVGIIFIMELTHCPVDSGEHAQKVFLGSIDVEDLYHCWDEPRPCLMGVVISHWIITWV